MDAQTSLTSKLWELGINGTGEVVGVADTGLDDESCFFFDSSLGNITRSPKDASSNMNELETDLSQRKVVQYVTYVDGQDEFGGHGTHVVGSIVGDVSSEFSGQSGCLFEESITITDSLETVELYAGQVTRVRITIRSSKP